MVYPLITKVGMYRIAEFASGGMVNTIDPLFTTLESVYKRTPEVFLSCMETDVPVEK
jgi:hypothetical protein